MQEEKLYVPDLDIDHPFPFTDLSHLVDRQLREYGFDLAQKSFEESNGFYDNQAGFQVTRTYKLSEPVRVTYTKKLLIKDDFTAQEVTGVETRLDRERSFRYRVPPDILVEKLADPTTGSETLTVQSSKGPFEVKLRASHKNSPSYVTLSWKLGDNYCPQPQSALELIQHHLPFVKGYTGETDWRFNGELGNDPDKMVKYIMDMLTLAKDVSNTQGSI